MTIPSSQSAHLTHNLLQSLQTVSPSLALWRRDFHRFPESAWMEFRTAATILTHLQHLGYTVHMGEQAASPAHRMGVPSATALQKARERAVDEGADPVLVARMGEGFTGFWADLVCGEDPQSVHSSGESSFSDSADGILALRFEMDCNEVQESASPEHRPVREGFASVHPDLMHACGHDGHAAVGMGLAEVLAVLRTHLRGRIRLLFQPAEEGAWGALPMLEAGALDGVTQLLGFHIGFKAGGADDLICGTRDFLATTKRNVSFSGVPAHAAAAPEEGKNALLAACAATLNLHAIARSGKGDTRITVGKLEGGTARNIIPSSASLRMETRGQTTKLDAYMGTEAERIIRAAADMWGCTCSIELVGCACGGTSSPELARLVLETASCMGCYKTIREMESFGATEDFSYLLTRVQETGGSATYLQVGAHRSSGHHTDTFDFDESCLPRTLELLARIVCQLNGSPESSEPQK